VYNNNSSTTYSWNAETRKVPITPSIEEYSATKIIVSKGKEEDDDWYLY